MNRINDLKAKYLNLRIWKRISVPAVIIVFSWLLMYFHYRESVRITEVLSEAIKAAEEAALSAAQVKAENSAIENEKMENFKATAYSIKGITKSGVPVAPGQVAADPRIIPLGSMIYVESPLMSGIYQVTDTGRLIKGKIIDIFIPSYRRSIEFGRRDVKVKVLRYGYEDKKTTE
jgi:3D (Asp-Asp-Asp) domain-containing protein